MTFNKLFTDFLDEMGLFVTDWDLLDDALIEAGFLEGLETVIEQTKQ
jgi:hypothetical protein